MVSYDQVDIMARVKFLNGGNNASCNLKVDMCPTLLDVALIGRLATTAGATAPLV